MAAAVPTPLQCIPYMYVCRPNPEVRMYVNWNLVWHFNMTNVAC